MYDIDSITVCLHKHGEGKLPLDIIHAQLLWDLMSFIVRHTDEWPIFVPK